MCTRTVYTASQLPGEDALLWQLRASIDDQMMIAFFSRASRTSRVSHVYHSSSSLRPSASSDAGGNDAACVAA